MCMKILSSEDKVSSKEIRFTMVGGTYADPNKEMPMLPWISKKIWATICEAVDTLPCFENFN